VGRGTVPGGGAPNRWVWPVSGARERETRTWARGPAREGNGVAEPR
jgi:hypothetical protein